MKKILLTLLLLSCKKRIVTDEGHVWNDLPSHATCSDEHFGTWDCIAEGRAYLCILGTRDVWCAPFAPVACEIPK